VHLLPPCFQSQGRSHPRDQRPPGALFPGAGPGGTEERIGFRSKITPQDGRAVLVVTFSSEEVIAIRLLQISNDRGVARIRPSDRWRKEA
jgi:hypothetical protein